MPSVPAGRSRTGHTRPTLGQARCFSHIVVFFLLFLTPVTSLSPVTVSIFISCRFCFTDRPHPFYPEIRPNLAKKTDNEKKKLPQADEVSWETAEKQTRLQVGGSPGGGKRRAEDRGSGTGTRAGLLLDFGGCAAFLCL